jgi:hypothetical protein
VADLHLKSEEECKALQVAVRGFLRESKANSSLVLIEYDPTQLSESAKAWVGELVARPDARLVGLPDLPPAKALELVRRATEDHPLSQEEADEIVVVRVAAPCFFLRPFASAF